MRYASEVNDLIDAALAELDVETALSLVDEGALRRMLTHFRNVSFNFDWGGCADVSCEKVEGFAFEFHDGAKVAGGLLSALDRAKVDLFAEPDRRLEKLLLLIADHFRQDVRFPMSKDSTDPNLLLASYYADLVRYTHRPFNLAQPDVGNFGASDFRWATPETVQVDLISRKNFRAAGVYALPGETFRVTRLDASPVTTKVFVNTIRPNAGRMWERGGYVRPNNLRGPSHTVAPGESVLLTSAIGGPIQIEFNANDEPVSLQFEHVGRHPVWRSPADTAEFLATIEASRSTWLRYNWVEFIIPFFEIHSRHPQILGLLNWPFGADALPDAISYYYHQLTRSLAAYEGDGVTPIPEVDAIAAAHGWSYRRVDFVGHANTDMATCGSACSGNPWDTGRHFNPIGHGALHELGHNMQGGVRFEGWNNHTMTNHYSMYVKKHFYNDTGLATVLGDWVCWKEGDSGPSNAQILYEIVQESVTQPDPFAYVRARVRDQSVPVPDEDDDEELADYPEVVTGSVVEGLAAAIWSNLEWMAEYHGALANGDHLRTLVHLVDYNFSLAEKNEATWLAGRDALGMGQYSLDEAKAMSHDDLQLIAMSFATGLDYREPFAMFGINISAKAGAQVEALGLYPLPREMQGPHALPRCPLGEPGTALPVDGISAWPAD